MLYTLKALYLSGSKDEVATRKWLSVWLAKVAKTIYWHLKVLV